MSGCHSILSIQKKDKGRFYLQQTIMTGEIINFRKYIESDFSQIILLSREEGWNNLVQQEDKTRKAWSNSNVKFVVTAEKAVIGYIRGLTDENITLYICEVLIRKEYRGLGIGKQLIKYIHGFYPETRMELLASSSSNTYYEGLNFREFYGYRKTIKE
jgi:ribosomal protein S18 acetylase RimI-like enzyme